MLNHYVVNLPESKDRQKLMTDEFKKIGIAPHLFPAVNGKALSEKQKKELCINSALTDSEIGCAASHLEIYKDFLLTDEKSIFVFEDDVAIHPGTNPEILEECQKFINSLATPSVLMLRRRRRMGPKVGNAGGINIYKCFRSTSTISYLINRRGAAVVLKYNTPIRFEADMWGLYAKAGLLNIYSLEENLFSPRPEEEVKSTIGNHKNRASHSKIHKKIKRQFLKEHGYTFMNQLEDWIFPLYYSVRRIFLP